MQGLQNVTMLIVFALGILAPPALAQEQSAELTAPVRLEADGIPIDTGKYIGHSGPLVYDYDGDGKQDVLVGNFRGHIQVYRNVGTKTQPKLEAQGLLEAGEGTLKIKNW